MGYRCIRPDGAMPCISEKRFDPISGNPLDKPKRRFKSVKLDDVVGWVDLCSRKHFEPTDEATKAQDAKDFAAMKKELAELGNKLPNDATFAECAESLARIKAMTKKRLANPKKRLFVKNAPKKKPAAQSSDND
jgi:hypothetical protein